MITSSKDIKGSKLIQRRQKRKINPSVDQIQNEKRRKRENSNFEHVNSTEAIDDIGK